LEASDVTTNEMLVKFLPELASSYGKYPLRYNRWLSPGERGPNGEPCFISAPHNMGIKEPYVWGHREPKGTGYYHLLTKAAYEVLYSRIKDDPPVDGFLCCFTCSKEARNEREEWEYVKQIIYHRHLALVPNDSAAQS